MKQFLKTYKKNLLQILGLSIGYLITRSPVFLILVLFFSLLLLLFPDISVKFTRWADTILNVAGNLLKKIILFLLYLLILLPVAFFRRLFSGRRKQADGQSGFINRTPDQSTVNMEVMW